MIVTWQSTPTHGEQPTIITIRFMGGNQSFGYVWYCDGTKSFKGP
jgi:hypothetical protein